LIERDQDGSDESEARDPDDGEDGEEHSQQIKKLFPSQANSPSPTLYRAAFVLRAKFKDKDGDHEWHKKSRKVIRESCSEIIPDAGKDNPGYPSRKLLDAWTKKFQDYLSLVGEDGVDDQLFPGWPKISKKISSWL
jgi:hypothetical protein